mgnify:CR=1 FL=1
MKNYLTKFESYEKYQNYINSENAIFPNVSICEDRPGDSYFMHFPKALRFKALKDFKDLHVKIHDRMFIKDILDN